MQDCCLRSPRGKLAPWARGWERKIVPVFPGLQPGAWRWRSRWLCWLWKPLPGPCACASFPAGRAPSQWRGRPHRVISGPTRAPGSHRLHCRGHRSSPLWCSETAARPRRPGTARKPTRGPGDTRAGLSGGACTAGSALEPRGCTACPPCSCPCRPRSLPKGSETGGNPGGTSSRRTASGRRPSRRRPSVPASGKGGLTSRRRE
mmetsp:Transcript_70270/g.164868  ORF Transcript_70270/g.164868 Transcript_70270/m.164868 type:complete len:204 (+) Transcript_70270:978-1589(+)